MVTTVLTNDNRSTTTEDLSFSFVRMIKSTVDYSIDLKQMNESSNSITKMKNS